MHRLFVFALFDGIEKLGKANVENISKMAVVIPTYSTLVEYLAIQHV